MRKRLLSIAAYVFLIAFGAAACDTNDPAADEIAEIRMEPDDATMTVGETTDFSVMGVTESGDVVEDANLDFQWWSTDTTVFTVTENGVATARGEGEAFCVAESNALSKAGMMFVGRDSAFVTVLK